MNPTSPDGAPPAPWWRSAVTYQVYLRSFADGDGDGLGDVAGIRSRLPYLADLGVDAIWINPWYPSPQADAGYDVADYRDIDPAFGTLDDALALIREAHALGLRVLLDIVPNHTSDAHPWFSAALAAPPGSRERARYVFRAGRRPDDHPDGALPPNDWQSVFGGGAWERVTEADGRPGEWYLHLFDTRQPDLDWSNPEVRAEFHDVLRFWFDHGVDGFRIDVAHGLVKDPALPDLAGRDPHGRDTAGPPAVAAGAQEHPHWDRAGVHEIYRGWRAVADSYDPPRVFVAEAWVASADRLAAYLRPDELHTAFDFDFIRIPWTAEGLRGTARTSLAAHDAVGAPVMWVLSNHDVPRHVTRLGRDNAERAGHPQLPSDHGSIDLAVGRRRARAVLLLELALPGGVYLYQGEELGLEEVEDLADALRQDPVFRRTGGAHKGRDGCRVPLPWTSTGVSLGFGDAPAWLPQPVGWQALSVEAQRSDPQSVLTLYRTALRLRRDLVADGTFGAGSAGALDWFDADSADLVAFARTGRSGRRVACLLNLGAAPVTLPEGRVLLASVEPAVDPATGARLLPRDASAWVQLA